MARRRTEPGEPMVTRPVRFPREVLDAAAVAAERRGQTVSDYIRDAVEARLKKEKKP